MERLVFDSYKNGVRYVLTGVILILAIVLVVTHQYLMGALVIIPAAVAFNAQNKIVFDPEAKTVRIYRGLRPLVPESASFGQIRSIQISRYHGEQAVVFQLKMMVGRYDEHTIRSGSLTDIADVAEQISLMTACPVTQSLELLEQSSQLNRLQRLSQHSDEPRSE